MNIRIPYQISIKIVQFCFLFRTCYKSCSETSRKLLSPPFCKLVIFDMREVFGLVFFAVLPLVQNWLITGPRFCWGSGGCWTTQRRSLRLLGVRLLLSWAAAMPLPSGLRFLPTSTFSLFSLQMERHLLQRTCRGLSRTVGRAFLYLAGGFILRRRSIFDGGSMGNFFSWK